MDSMCLSQAVRDTRLGTTDVETGIVLFFLRKMVSILKHGVPNLESIIPVVEVWNVLHVAISNVVGDAERSVGHRGL